MMTIDQIDKTRVPQHVAIIMIGPRPKSTG